MTYKEFGKDHSTMIVFIHGGGVSGWMWDRQVDYFSSNYHCVVVNMTEPANAEFTIDTAADEIISTIETLGKNKRIIVVGFSLGSQVLIAMLDKKPHLIDSAMINSALVKPLPFAKTLISSMSFTLPLAKHRLFSDLQAKSLYIDNDHLDIYFKENRRMDRAAFVSIMSENMSFRLPDNLKETTSRILITVGEKERKAMKDSATMIADLIPKSQTIVVPNIGHGFPLANPDLFNSVLKEWIENNTGTHAANKLA